MPDGSLTDKKSAEESGFLSLFEVSAKASCRIGTTESVVDYIVTTPMQTPCGGMGYGQMCTTYVSTPIFKNVAITSFAQSNIKTIDSLSNLSRTLAPDSLQETRSALLSALSAEGKNSKSLKAEAGKSCAAYRQFSAAVDQRVKSVKTNNSVFITYKPPSIKGIPLPGVKYDSRSGIGFALQQSIAVPTPYGTVTVGYKSAPGIHFLRVVTDDKQRVLTLDRPFEFFVPKGYLVRVAYEGKDELILYVSKS